MLFVYSFFLFLITVIGGSIPLFVSSLNGQRTNLILAFSGSFLLGITLLHLLPETFEELGHGAGILLLVGFFVQLFIQRFTHGVEHGHVHQAVSDDHHGHHPEHEHPVHAHAMPLRAMLAGLAVHAFMEGIPLGYNYRIEATGPSLYLAVAAHKLPEAMLITTLIRTMSGRSGAWMNLISFAAITPLASLVAVYLGQKFFAVSQLIEWLIPVVAGAFIHIATTIFYESGTRHHALTRPKLVAILLGVGLAVMTLLIE